MLSLPISYPQELDENTLALYTAIGKYTGAREFREQERELFAAAPEQAIVTQFQRRLCCIAGSTIAAGELANFYASGSELRARPSDNSLGYSARGYCTLAAGAGEVGEFVLLEGLITVAGLTPAALYYLGNVGGISAAPTSQVVGFALSSTLLYFKVNL